jgi:pimeloyl-ACP methyl ester carboxylesterase
MGFCLRLVRNNPAQVHASQYERDYITARAPYPAWFNYYRADPIKVPPSVAEAANLEVQDLAAQFFAGVAETPVSMSLRVDVPTLVLWGMHDPVLLPSQLDHLGDFMSLGVVVRIENGGHYPMRSHSELVNRAIRDFTTHTRSYSSGP